MFLKNLFGRKDSAAGGSRETPARGGAGNVTFSVDWPAAIAGRTGVLEQARLLLTDVGPLSASDVLALKGGALAGVSGPAVLVAPGFMSDALQLMAGDNLYGVVAGDAGVERLDELLLDLAILTHGKTLAAAFGIGLPKPRGGEKTPGGLMIPGTGWADFKAESGDLGLAHKVTIGAQTLTVETSVSPAELDPHLAGLLGQFQQAITDTDREAVARRFARFGRSPGTPPAAAAGPGIPADAIRIPGGYASPFFVTDPACGRADWENPFLLITNSELNSVGQLAGPLDHAVAQGLTPLAVIAPRIRQGALAFLVLNKMCGRLPAVGIHVPLPPEEAVAALDNLARATGTAVLHSPAD